jgi:hypothetical protein
MRCRAAAATSLSRTVKSYAPGVGSSCHQPTVIRRDSTPELAMRVICCSSWASGTSAGLAISGGSTVPKKPKGTLRFAASAGVATAPVSTTTRAKRRTLSEVFFVIR